MVIKHAHIQPSTTLTKSHVMVRMDAAIIHNLNRLTMLNVMETIHVIIYL